MSGDDRRTRVAIACQGGGSHTAFTAGVLKRLLTAEALAGYQVVGLSGTSGGAICALLAWSALLEEQPDRAGERLEAFWADNSASGPLARSVNAWVVWATALQDVVATPAVSPYDSPFATAGLDELRRLLERQVDFEALAARVKEDSPRLVVGAVDVRSGEFRAFDSRREAISAEMILASAALPTLFRAVPVGGGAYWDGLFSQNPPVGEMVDTRPDELWVIQINAKKIDREPRTLTEIADRRNELAGNLSLHQELGFIEKVDEMLEAGELVDDGSYKRITVRIVELARSKSSIALGTASKVNRDPAFIRELIADGERRAEDFLMALAFERAWERGDAEAVVGILAKDARVHATDPFPALEAQDTGSILAFAREHLGTGIVVDRTKKQMTGDRLVWSLLVHPDGAGAPVRGRAVADLRDGRIAALRFGPE